MVSYRISRHVFQLSISNPCLHNSVLIAPISICRYSKTTEAEGAKVEPKVSKKESQRLAEFRKKLRETTPIEDLGDQPLTPPTVKGDSLPPWPDNKNPHTGESNGPRGPEPTRYGDWERKGRVSDF